MTKTDRINYLNQVIEDAYGIIRFARDMGVTHQAVTGWRRRGCVPPERALEMAEKYGADPEKLVSPAIQEMLRRRDAANLV